MRLIESCELTHVFGGAPEGGYEVSELIVEGNPKDIVTPQMLDQLWTSLVAKGIVCMATTFEAQESLNMKPTKNPMDMKPTKNPMALLPLPQIVNTIVFSAMSYISCSDMEQASKDYADARERYDAGHYGP